MSIDNNKAKMAYLTRENMLLKINSGELDEYDRVVVTDENYKEYIISPDLEAISINNDYNNLNNIPQINGNILIGNKSSSQLGLVDINSIGNLENLHTQDKSNIVNAINSINNVIANPTLIGDEDSLNGIEIGGVKYLIDSKGSEDYEELINLPKINNITLKGNNSFSDLGIIPENLTYSNISQPNIDNVKEALDNLISKVYYVAPSITSFTCSPSTTQYEIGTEINGVDFAWSVNKEITSQSLTNCDIGLEDRTASYDTPFSNNKSFTLTISDGVNNASSTKSFTFLPKVYYGAAEDVESYDSEFIVGLGGSLKSGKSGTYNLTIGSNKYGFIAVPTSYGKISVVKIGGFDTEMIDCGTISVTNSSGYTQNYYLSKTPQPNLGTISMIVS